jgi:DNA repair ATPase RecN
LNEEDCQQCKRKVEEVRQLVRAYHSDLREVIRTLDSFKARLKDIDSIPQIRMDVDILQEKGKK